MVPMNGDRGSAFSSLYLRRLGLKRSDCCFQIQCHERKEHLAKIAEHGYKLSVIPKVDILTRQNQTNFAQGCGEVQFSNFEPESRLSPPEIVFASEIS